VPTFHGYPNGALVALAPTGRASALCLRLDQQREPSPDQSVIDLDAVYGCLAAEIDDLDIEAAAVNGDVVSLFHRGSGASPSARIDLDLAEFTASLAAGRGPGAGAIRSIRPYDLGEAGGAVRGFTDASPLPDARVVFACSAGPGGPASSAVGLMATGGELESLEDVDEPLTLDGLAAQLEPSGIELLTMARERPGRLLGTKLALP